MKPVNVLDSEGTVLGKKQGLRSGINAFAWNSIEHPCSEIVAQDTFDFYLARAGRDRDTEH